MQVQRHDDHVPRRLLAGDLLCALAGLPGRDAGPCRARRVHVARPGEGQVVGLIGQEGHDHALRFDVPGRAGRRQVRARTDGSDPLGLEPRHRGRDVRRAAVEHVVVRQRRDVDRRPHVPPGRLGRRGQGGVPGEARARCPAVGERTFMVEQEHVRRGEEGRDRCEWIVACIQGPEGVADTDQRHRGRSARLRGPIGDDERSPLRTAAAAGVQHQARDEREDRSPRKHARSSLCPDLPRPRLRAAAPPRPSSPTVGGNG